MKLREALRLLPVERLRNPPPLVAVVPLRGVIGAIGPLRRGLTLQSVAGPLDRAFAADAAAVALIVNSPGGSAAQSALIARRVRALADERSRPVFAFVEDVAASGGYWIACAADEIWADEVSIVGSIGVISAGFGLDRLIARWGVERRVYAAGAHKDGLDPFQPEKPKEVAHLRALQEEVFASFQAHVRARRGAKLAAPEPEIFNGRFWTGRAALSLGLIDGLGDARSQLRARFGEKVRLRVFADGRPWWRRKLGLPELAGDSAAGAPPASWADAALSAVEERSLWSRFGL